MLQSIGQTSLVEKKRIVTISLPEPIAQRFDAIAGSLRGKQTKWIVASASVLALLSSPEARQRRLLRDVAAADVDESGFDDLIERETKDVGSPAERLEKLIQFKQISPEKLAAAGTSKELVKSLLAGGTASSREIRRLFANLQESTVPDWGKALITPEEGPAPLDVVLAYIEHASIEDITTINKAADARLKALAKGAKK